MGDLSFLMVTTLLQPCTRSTVGIRERREFQCLLPLLCETRKKLPSRGDPCHLCHAQKARKRPVFCQKNNVSHSEEAWGASDSNSSL